MAFPDESRSRRVAHGWLLFVEAGTTAAAKSSYSALEVSKIGSA